LDKTLLTASRVHDTATVGVYTEELSEDVAGDLVVRQPGVGSIQGAHDVQIDRFLTELRQGGCCRQYNIHDHRTGPPCPQKVDRLTAFNPIDGIASPPEIGFSGDAQAPGQLPLAVPYLRS
jgi:hypothetical protein